MEPLAIVEMGIFCPVGLDAQQSAASIWAGVPGTRESCIRSQRHGPIVMGHLPLQVLPPLIEPLDRPELKLSELQQRLLRLATPALQEALGAMSRREPAVAEGQPRLTSRVLPPGLEQLPPLLVAGPAVDSGSPEILGEAFIEQLALQAGVPVDTARGRIFPTGHAGFFAALHYAQTELFATGQAELCVVGGVDSYLDVDRAARLEKESRLHNRGPRDSFIPGEAAAFVLVAPREACRRYGLQPLAWIEAIGVGQEPGHRHGDHPHRGDGLTQAFAQVFRPGASRLPPVRLVMAGLNGEQLPAEEWGVAYLRHREHFAEPLRIEQSAEYTGDAGAALAPLMLGVAVAGLRNRRVEGPALVWASSDTEQRGALLLQAS